MRVIEPKHLEQRKLHRDKRAKKRRHKRRIIPLMFLVILIYMIIVALIPVPNLDAEPKAITNATSTSVKINWPNYGQASLGAVGYGLLASNGEQKPIPIASIAKVITAVSVLKVRPLSPGDQGDKIVFTQEDVDTYNKFYSQGQSVVPVKAGEEITQYQALEALLLPSSNNMADILVVWAFGSNKAYLEFVNPFTKSIGMKDTVIADASGFSPQTVSTSADLTKLAEIAMNHPVISEIVGKKQTTIPVAGEVYNVNRILGINGVNGVKTGNTDEAGGCFMFSAKRNIDKDHSVTVVGAIMGAENLSRAIDDSLPLLDEAFNNFKLYVPIKENEIVAKIKQNGGGSSNVIASKSLAIVVWNDQPIRSEYVQSNLRHSIRTGDSTGNVLVHVGNMVYKIPTHSDGSIESRGYTWKLLNLAGYL